LRIIAGTARGRRFEAPPGMDTRPTLDRVKEAVFGMLHFDLPGSAVLDLFSGSGSLGFEAASRGANRVVCNDRNRVCADMIRLNAERLGFGNVVRTLCMDYADCVSLLAREGARFDFVFLDAPYADGTASRAAELVFERGLLARGGRVLLEHAVSLPPGVSVEGARIASQRRYGAVAVTIYERL